MATRQQFEDMQVHGHLTAVGIDNQDQLITHVSPGIAPTDAVNVSQLATVVGQDEVYIGPGLPPASQDLWVDTDEPGIFDIIKDLQERVERLEARLK